MAKINNKPVIGIVPSFDEGLRIPAGGGDIKRIYIRHEYMSMLAQVGAVPLVLSPEMDIVDVIDLCDGIVLSGGEDIDPKFYGQELIPQPRVRYNEPASRFAWEEKLIGACDATRTPILGICYGMQRLNVHYGGTLLQDIETLRPDNIGHDNIPHQITFKHEFLGMKASGVHEISSRHHQAIDELADGLRVCAVAPDGIVEAVDGHGHFGMQWHPESDETGAHVYRSFVEHCLEVNGAIDQPQL